VETSGDCFVSLLAAGPLPATGPCRATGTGWPGGTEGRSSSRSLLPPKRGTPKRELHSGSPRNDPLAKELYEYLRQRACRCCTPQCASVSAQARDQRVTRKYPVGSQSRSCSLPISPPASSVHNTDQRSPNSCLAEFKCPACRLREVSCAQDRPQGGTKSEQREPVHSPCPCANTHQTSSINYSRISKFSAQRRH